MLNAPPPTPTVPHIRSAFVYHTQPEDLLQGQRVIVHIMSRTVVSIHTSCPHTVHMAVLIFMPPGNIYDCGMHTKPVAAEEIIRNHQRGIHLCPTEPK